MLRAGKQIAKVWIASIALVAMPHVAHACSVCFGASDAPQTKGMNMAIMTLLIVIGGVLIALAAFFLHLRRQARLHRMPAMSYVDHVETRFRSEDVSI